MNSQLSTSEPAAGSLNRSPSVLLIEDDEFQRATIMTQLLAHNISRIQAAPDVEVALELLREPHNPFDVTLCDLKLNESDGIAFLLSADPKKLGAIVLHSAMPPDVQQATVNLLQGRGVPVTACIPKPLNMPAFFHMLKGLKKQPEAPVAESDLPGLPIRFGRGDVVSGLRRGEFIAHFQPQLNLETHALYAIECLARWNHPSFGLLLPQDFLPSVLRHGLMDELTWQVMDYCLQCLKRWPKSVELPRVGINVSASSLKNNSFVDGWKKRVTGAGIHPEKIILELTETEVASNDGALLEVLTKLRILGFGIALDDFGVGHTSLSQLRQLPITELKIDRSFVSRISSSRRGLVLLDAMIYMANQLALTSVAEGIESPADAELLRDFGCKVGQGYHFSRPMPEDKLFYWIKG